MDYCKLNREWSQRAVVANWWQVKCSFALFQIGEQGLCIYKGKNTGAAF